MFGKPGLGNECGKARCQKNHYEPWTEAKKERSKRDHRDHVLDDLECVVDQFYRFVAALAAGILQSVVIIGVLEESQLQCQCLANDLTADAVGELELDQLLNQPARVVERGAEQEEK